MACKPPAKRSLEGWVEWAARELERRGVVLHSGARVDSVPEDEERPDFVIVATGALPAAPSIPGIEGDNVVEARDVLLGRAETGDEAIILGSGYVGMETADFLIARGSDVTLLEARSNPPINRMTAHGYWLSKRLADSGGKLLLGAEVLAVEPDAVIYRQDGEKKSVGSAGTTVVVALGAKPNAGLAGVLEREGVPFKVVGDASDPRRLLDAVHEGDAAGRAIQVSHG
jgi:pyruvate/2-oxoglutarate dehydrogenase complex dihydrolipoamide dehydrogenase (E3) component